MDQSWLNDANKLIESDALFAYDMCLCTAEANHLDVEYVLEKFISEFRKISRRD